MKDRPSNLAELGEAFVHLGTLMQNKNTTVEQLVRAAHACGLDIGLSIRTTASEDTPEEQA